MSSEPTRSTEPRHVTDPRDLRAVAHPVRLAILEHLTVDGPLTATELAGRIDESPANCSWHLRKLAEHGFVVEAAGGTGRQRPWKAAQRGMDWDEGEPESPEAAHAGEALTRVIFAREADRLWAFTARRTQEPAQWRAASAMSQSMQWLTADELDEIKTAVWDLLTRRSDRFDDPSLRPEGARLCSFLAWGVPAQADAAVEER